MGSFGLAVAAPASSALSLAAMSSWACATPESAASSALAGLAVTADGASASGASAVTGLVAAGRRMGCVIAGPLRFSER